jgi:hypothetical protein
MDATANYTPSFRMLRMVETNVMRQQINSVILASVAAAMLASPATAGEEPKRGGTLI